MPKPKDPKNMSSDPQDVFKFTKKQRLQLLANLIVDKMEEDRKQGYPLLRKIEAIEAEKAKGLKKKTKHEER